MDAFDPGYPPLSYACDDAHRQGGVVIWCHNGRGMEAPVAAALGKLDWIGVQVFEQALRMTRTLLTQRLGLTFSREARVAIHHELLYSSWSDLESQRTGDLVSRFGPDIDAVEEVLSNRLPALLIQGLGFAMTIGALVWINALLATVVVVPVVVVALVARRFNAAVGPQYQV